jgi:hypothetical protein
VVEAHDGRVKKEQLQKDKVYFYELALEIKNKRGGS